MRAAMFDRFGPPEVLEVREVPEPRPGRGELAVDVHAAALNPKDLLIRKGKLRWLTGRGFPRPTGFDVAGIVADVGAGVTRFARGDRVFGFRDGLRGGTVAECVVMPDGELARAPAALSFDEAAAVPLVGVTAIQALRDLGRVRAGERVCIHGASGGLGTLCVQVARALGGTVTSVSSERNLELCRALGALETLDYRRQDPLAQRWDVFMDCFGDRPYEQARRALAPGGRYVSVVIRARAIARETAVRFGVLRSPARLVSVRPRVADLEQLARWLDDGLVRPVVDRVFPLDEIAAAHRHLETRRARGKVVVAIR